MATRRIGIIMHGATSRIGTTQHLLNSLVPIRAEGGLLLANGDRWERELARNISLDAPYR